MKIETQYITEEEKRRIYNHEYYLKNRERILRKNRAWSKAQRQSESEDERYSLMVETTRKRYGKDHYRKLGKKSSEMYSGERNGLAEYHKRKRKENQSFDDRMEEILGQ